ncbi:gas vesicle protein [Micromonospora sp. DR5-3]|uniref:gas vesicle protein GvpJ n=1 Tax=unclassified Micromonospora TaxID=2617518 RepID=UPI0011DA28F9|nr:MULTISPECIES: gas vesicle protein GvpJ [unclassified Micromonospora]MCW3819413.1 gas vesicle protein [Micromonospora sp. DR5-3]TYC20799.1 gas vesicle protein [Micromonospora sp. MP36]
MAEQRDLGTRLTGTTDLVDLLDRIVDRGAVISGDVVIGLAGIDLIRLDLNLLLISVQRLDDLQAGLDNHEHGGVSDREPGNA